MAVSFVIVTFLVFGVAFGLIAFAVVLFCQFLVLPLGLLIVVVSCLRFIIQVCHSGTLKGGFINEFR